MQNGHEIDLGDNLPQMAPPFKVLALYKFADLGDCVATKPLLAKFCCARKIRGSFILAPEGINGTVAGTPPAIDALVAFLLDDPLFEGRLAGAELKFSTSPTMPFVRMKVRLKPEIVTLRAPEANTARRVGTYVAPKDWNALITADDVTLIDARNHYEARLGSFAGALDPDLGSFAEFKDFVSDSLDPARHRKVAMFCTGGIRCEKASSYLLSRGFAEVFHLKGGILDYLKLVPPQQTLWQGECFVFDERVAVGHGLEIGDATLCRACRTPLTANDRTHADYLEGVRCPHCVGDTGKHAAAAERQRQMQLAKGRNQSHLGADAEAFAAANRAAKTVRRHQLKRRPAPDVPTESERRSILFVGASDSPEK